MQLERNVSPLSALFSRLLAYFKGLPVQLRRLARLGVDELYVFAAAVDVDVDVDGMKERKACSCSLAVPLSLSLTHRGF
jgi:hypothetical protein